MNFFTAIAIFIGLLPVGSAAFIYEVKILRKWDNKYSRYQYVIGFSDFHDKIHEKNKMQVAIHLQTGIKLCGEIEAHDERIITLKDNKKTQIIYKHAISTIVPDINN